MKIACCQFAPRYRDPEQNLGTIEKLASVTESDILVFPELALTGYFFTSPDELENLAEPIDGPLAAGLSRIARTQSKALIVGFLERVGKHFFNSSIAFDCYGNLVGHYRKVHLFYFETRIFTRGDLGFPVFDLETENGSARTGMLVCYDWRFPESARSLALHGAELVAIPSNIVTTTGMLHTVLQTRSFENKVVIAFADRTGAETNGGESLTFRGESALIDYNGEIVQRASAGDEESIVYDFNLEKTRQKQINAFNDIFADRASDTYRI